MTLDDLIAEGEALSKPCWALGTAPTESGIVGYWCGERSDKPNRLTPEVTAYRGRRHIVTLSETLLAELDVRQGPVSLFEWDSAVEGRSTRVEADYRLRFADLQFTGEPLFATREKSFPPFPVVCLYGSERVARWLASLGLPRDDYWRATGELERQYTAEWTRRSVFYRKSGDVMVGGWHFLWPEDDYFVPPPLQLVALTLRDAEPWYELWYSRSRSGFRVRERIS